MEAIIILPKTSSDVGELLKQAHKAERENARRMLDIILTSVRYLAYQGLPLRGDTSEESNLVQLLRLWAKDNPLLLNWLQKPANKYMSPEN